MLVSKGGTPFLKTSATTLLTPCNASDHFSNLLITFENSIFEDGKGYVIYGM